MTLDGKVVLVTGAALGLGHGIARAVGQAGARVCATDVDPGSLARSAALLRADGSTVETARLDAADLTAFQQRVDGVLDRWGRLDAVVHAGIRMPLEPWETTGEAEWWGQLRISLGGLMNAARAAWGPMKRQGGGHLIGIASGSSFRGYRDEVLYCAGKHAVEGFVKALALEAAPDRISLNTVGPGQRVKPTGVTWAQQDLAPAAVRQGWTNPVLLGRAFVWLIGQPAGLYSGLRFDAGPLVDTIDREGWGFAFSPEKATLYPDDMRARLDWIARYDELNP
jgi:NAD(P)-dependent dehydrogenase (short-subunit alcohol dehydrogenase family)